MNSYVVGLTLVFASVVLSIVGLIIIRRKVDIKTLAECHEVGGYLFAAIGTLYAVLLGLLVVDSLSRYQDAAHKVEEEANSIANIYLLSEELPAAKRDQIQGLCKDYCKSVVEAEWSAMADGKYSADSRAAAIRLVRAVNSIKPANEAESQIAATAMSQACDFWSDRRSRIVTCTHSIPAIEWVVLIVGGVVTIIFTYFFGLENLFVQTAMTGLVALMTSLNVFLFFMFSEPHRGGLALRNDSFKGDLHIFEGSVEILPELKSQKLKKDIQM